MCAPYLYSCIGAGGDSRPKSMYGREGRGETARATGRFAVCPSLSQRMPIQLPSVKWTRIVNPFRVESLSSQASFLNGLFN